MCRIHESAEGVVGQRKRGRPVFRTIAVATDGSPSAVNAVAAAEDLARHFGAKLTFIHVQEVTVGRGGTFVRPSQSTLAALRDRTAQLQGEGIEATMSVSRATHSGIAGEITDLATKAGADLLIVGSSAHGALARMVLGSVGGQLRRGAPWPVLTVPFEYPLATAAQDGEPAPGLRAVAK